MSKRRDPGEWIGEVGYHLVIAAVRLIEPFRRQRVTPNYYPGRGDRTEPEAVWMQCGPCGGSTWHIQIDWVGEQVVEWECDSCGAVAF